MSLASWARLIMTSAAQRQQLFGLAIDAATLDEALSRCEAAIRTRSRVLVGVVNAAKIVNLRKDARLRDSLLECDMILADGQSVVWASKILSRPLPERVAGIDLFEGLLDLADQKHYSVYLLGATPEVVAALAETIRRRFPGAVIAGWRDGYFADEEAESVADEITGPAGHALLGHGFSEEGDLPGTVRRQPRRAGAARGRRIVRCDGRRYPTGSRVLATTRP